MKKHTYSGTASAIAMLLPLLTAGCGSITPITPIGPDTYMVSNKSTTAFASGGEMMADLYQAANKFCTEQNKELMTVSTASRDGAPYQKATGQLQFRCLRRGDPGLQRPTLEPQPDVTIEMRH